MPIFIAKNGTSTGPYSEDDLTKMISGGLVSVSDLAWREGLANWVRVDQIVSAPPPPGSLPPIPEGNKSGQSIGPATPLGPSGIGGWLLLFAIGLVALGPFYQGSQVYELWTQTREAASHLPATFSAALALEIAAQVALLVYGMVVGVVLLRGEHWSIRAARQYLLIRVSGYFAVDFLALSMIRGLVSSGVFGTAVGEAAVGVFREVVYFAVWWIYFLKSKRVRNTLVLWQQRPSSAG